MKVVNERLPLLRPHPFLERLLVLGTVGVDAKMKSDTFEQRKDLATYSEVISLPIGV